MKESDKMLQKSKRTFTKQTKLNRETALLKYEAFFDGSKCKTCEKTLRYTHNTACVECCYPNAQPKNFEKRKKILLDKVKAQAKLKGRFFDIDVNDIEWVTHCPILGVELNYYSDNARARDTATFDRKDSSKGYVKGNVFIISNKANSCKSDLTIEQMERMIDYAKA